jgi:hypothetical protein
MSDTGSLCFEFVVALNFFLVFARIPWFRIKRATLSLLHVSPLPDRTL